MTSFVFMVWRRLTIFAIAILCVYWSYKHGIEVFAFFVILGLIGLFANIYFMATNNIRRRSNRKKSWFKPIPIGDIDNNNINFGIPDPSNPYLLNGANEYLFR